MTTDVPQLGDLATTHEYITELAKSIQIAQLQLSAVILGVCRGPHRIRQHRDDRPPWCDTCGYARNGERIRIPAGAL